MSVTPDEHAPAAAKAKDAPATPREIVASYPNHVWSVDRTRVLRWGIWPTWVLVAIDHYSRAVMAVVPLEGPNAGWLVDAMEEAFARHGPPRHLVSDQEKVLISEVLSDLLQQWNVKHRFGAVGRHGSIAVTERVILTLKYEWLKRVPVIRGIDHLDQLLRDALSLYRMPRPLIPVPLSALTRAIAWAAMRATPRLYCGRGVPSLHNRDTAAQACRAGAEAPVGHRLEAGSG